MMLCEACMCLLSSFYVPDTLKAEWPFLVINGPMCMVVSVSRLQLESTF